MKTVFAFQLPLSRSRRLRQILGVPGDGPSLSTPSLGITPSAGPGAHPGDGVDFQLPLSGSQAIIQMAGTGTPLELSTPSLGITESRSRLWQQNSADSFQLPLSGSQLFDDENDSVSLEGLSTPSLGITFTYRRQVLLAPHPFNSLSRDHWSFDSRCIYCIYRRAFNSLSRDHSAKSSPL